MDLSKLTTTPADPLPTDHTIASASPEPTISASKVSSKKKIIRIKKIVLSKKKANLRYGKKLKLKATITPQNATNKKIKWSVSNKKYASVTQRGVVKAKKKGISHNVKIYAKAKDGSCKKAVCLVKIKKKK